MHGPGPAEARLDTGRHFLTLRLGLAARPGGGFVTAWYQSGSLSSPGYVPAGSYAAVSELDPSANPCDPADPASLCLVAERSG